MVRFKNANGEVTSQPVLGWNKSSDQFCCVKILERLRDEVPKVLLNEGALRAVDVHSGDVNLGSFQAGGKTFEAGGYYSKETGKIDTKMNMQVFDHEFGHAEFQAFQQAAVKGIQGRFAENPAQDVKDLVDVAGLIRQPKNVNERAYNLFESMSSMAAHSKTYASDYAKAWASERVVDEGTSIEFRVGGSTFIAKFCNAHRSENENYAELGSKSRNQQWRSESGGMVDWNGHAISPELIRQYDKYKQVQALLKEL